MKSRPIWGRLKRNDAARAHLVCVEGEGLEAVVDLFGSRPAPASVTVLFREADERKPASGRKILGETCTFHTYPSRKTLISALKAHLEKASMGTCLHLAGGEAFLNEASAVASAHGVIGSGLQTELRGKPARRVQCVHCKGMMDEIEESPIVCAHCGVNLMVRDHYSRRLGAFMGVCVDAEAPGVLPETTRF
ncbi:dimethylamine monooxygenase subunit DmmA family protein [Fulvimarina sp. MAC8]|uniref:dimethylamine monooxygenase subunit DmmA family protein n=1 Tax=Fulvimarina sp. MAC8 TaxID=3162874 RepID=UPI0032ED22FE